MQVIISEPRHTESSNPTEAKPRVGEGGVKCQIKEVQEWGVLRPKLDVCE